MRHMNEQHTAQGAVNYYALMSPFDWAWHSKSNDFGARLIANTYEVSWGIEEVYYINEQWTYL